MSAISQDWAKMSYVALLDGAGEAARSPRTSSSSIKRASEASDEREICSEGVNRRRARKSSHGASHSPLHSGADHAADHLLEAMGYISELSRNRSTWQVAFMSFVLASIPYGLATTLIYPLVGGGPANVVWGWVGVSAIILCVAVSLGEITSVYPTAGGVYYQTFMLAPPWCRKILSWICGWSYVVGNITITLAVNFGTTLFLVACINVFQTGAGTEDDPFVEIFKAEPYQVILIFLGITFVCNAVSALGNKWLPWLDTFAIFWTFAGVITIVVSVLAVAKHGRRSPDFVFHTFEPSSGWPAGWSLCIGLLQAAYATSSTGMIISMCEEVQDPGIQVPRAMVATILMNFVAGLLFLLPLLFVLPDLAPLIALPSAQPVPTIIASAVGSPSAAFALLLPLLVLALFCGIGCTTAASRCTWAFSRDGAIPGSRWWRVVHPRLDVPLNAMLLSTAVQIILGALYFVSAAAFHAFSGVGVICLTLSYACPITVSLLGGRAHLKHGKFDLGFLGAACNVISIAWSVLAIPLFCMPSRLPVTADTMNYASVVFVGFVLVASLWYFLWGREHYVGPPVRDDEALERLQET